LFVAIAVVADLESKLAARSTELDASKKLVAESEAREEAAFQVFDYLL
jgi:hypothetical protein